MKRIIGIVMVLLISLSLFGCTAKQGSSFKPGSYTVTKEGFNKAEPFTLEVTIGEDKKITAIKVLEQHETDGLGAKALELLLPEIVAKQSLDLDAISTATVTSTAVFAAVREALAKAGLDEKELNASGSVTQEAKTYDADVVVVGAGGAGMTAAIVAKNAGANVLLVEKMELTGGNTVKSTGGMNAAKTVYQDKNEFNDAEREAIVAKIAKARAEYPELADLADIVEKQLDAYSLDSSNKGYFDSKELFILDTIVGGKGQNQRDLVEMMIDRSADGIEWLKGNGMDLDSVGAFGGASVKRIHRPMVDGKTAAVGAYIVPKLTHILEDKGIEVVYKTAANELIVENGVVKGVKCANGTVIHAKAVILATGGFGADLKRVAEYKPELKGFVTTNASGATGDGIDMAVAAGAKTVQMDQIQIHPTVEQKTSSLITEGVRGDGAILVNQEAVRFTNEVGTRDAVSAAEIAQTGGYAYLIFDQAMADASGPLTGYIKKGFAISASGYEELAKALTMDEKVFAETMAKWNQAVEAQKDEEFGRTAFTHPLDTAPYYAIKLSPGIHHTMGGLAINTKAEVLRDNGEVIPGLYAAGEVTGGVHGANRLGGNAVADIIVYGRIAGEQAANYSK